MIKSPFLIYFRLKVFNLLSGIASLLLKFIGWRGISHDMIRDQNRWEQGSRAILFSTNLRFEFDKVKLVIVLQIFFIYIVERFPLIFLFFFVGRFNQESFFLLSNSFKDESNILFILQQSNKTILSFHPYLFIYLFLC